MLKCAWLHDMLVVDEEEMEDDDDDEDSEIHTVVYFWQVPTNHLSCIIMFCYHGYCRDGMLVTWDG